jgi:GNAT superfamily N-acetyltransferase
MTAPDLRVVPLTPERWPDLEALFGRGGASYGCWCMFFRRSSTEMAGAKSAENRAALRALAGAEPAPGLLAYDGDEPVGWVGLGPRSGFERLVRSRFLAPVDDLPAWSIVCFFVARRRRGQGVARALLEGAVAYAREHGAPALEGYARDPGGSRLAADGAYTGTVSMFRAAGFHEAARAEPPGGGTPRVTMRLEWGRGPGSGG